MNKNLVVISLIAIVNALGYGIIIPILYTYSQKYGLTDFQNGLLFSAFSLAQFISTPIIGRMSDKYGRRPLLIFSLAGTALSFLIMAFAPSALWLFVARILDGITAGNLPVAQAVISDSTDAKNRAKGFGIIGASFGFGFIFGPLISALTLPYGTSTPFIIAAIVTFISVILTAVILPETNTHMGQVHAGRLFDFKRLFQAAFDKAIGDTLLISLLYTLAFAIFIYGFQPFSTKVLGLDATQISWIFTAVGIMGVITQVVVIPKLSRLFSEKKILVFALITAVFTQLSMFLTRNSVFFLIIVIINALTNGLVMPMVTTLLSKEVDAKSQGSIMGLNASYQSIGFIMGPIIGGAAATFMIPLPFLVGSFINLLCFVLARKILALHIHKESAF